MLAASLVLARYAPPPPALNVPPRPNFYQVCAAGGDASMSCLVATTQAIDHARHLEGLSPLYLPRDWTSLTPAEQLFVVTNLERTARGERPIFGLTQALNAVALAGAAEGRDPVTGPASEPAVSIWAADSGPLASDYNWMYFDGWEGTGTTLNLECTSPTAPGCWGHRNNILAEWSRVLLKNSPAAQYLEAGAAQTSIALSPLDPASMSDAMIMTASTSPPPYVFTWQHAVAEGAGNPATGWNPATESSPALILTDAIAWLRAYGIWLVAVGYLVYLLAASLRRRQLWPPPAPPPRTARKPGAVRHISRYRR